MKGDHRAAASLLEALLKPAAGGDGAGQSSQKLPPALAQDARYELALAYRALGRMADADKLLATLAAEPAGPLAADAQFLLGQAHVEAGRYAEAIPPLQRYLAENPRGEVAEFALADLVAAQLGAGRTEDAGKTLALLARQFPAGKALPRARLRIAEAALAARQFDRAVEQFHLVTGPVSPAASAPDGKSTTAIEPALRVRALAGLGHALEGQGRSAEAAAAFGAVVDLAPSDPVVPEMVMARARALEATDRPDDALAAYADAARRFASRDEGARAVLARARLLARLGRHEPAAAEFERQASILCDARSLARIGRRRPTSCSPNRAGRWWMPPGPPRPIECSPGC